MFDQNSKGSKTQKNNEFGNLALKLLRIKDRTYSKPKALQI